MELSPTGDDRKRHSLAVTALTVLAHVMLVVLALDRAAGVVLLDAQTSSWGVEYVDTGFWNAAWLLVPLAGVAAALWVWGGVLTVVLAVAAHTVAATTTIQRYHADDWGSGLEELSYFWPLGHLVLGVIVVAVGAIIGRAHRRSRARLDAAGRR
ncbi:hypothetical protein [Nocardioides massiliensis]|uniref:Integral membrane protein n=1 Tax=Nocardioides massiliensis TaxID=1325935 RepID=A0ABT9NMS4_9ACTN|nr:hypothetical protein [Nocardioides massiliensis]MDP9821340.1 hypothetical protein [Nocardioides massiliensis]